MRVVYLVVTLLAVLTNGCAAVLSLAGAKPVTAVADRLQLPRRCMLPFGVLLASGALGLLLGIAVPVLGAAAATGLVLYFVCALAVHAARRDRQVGGAVFFLVLDVAALLTGLAYHPPW
jgi:hypothetical protein